MLNRLEALKGLKEEMDGIEGTEEELYTISDHLLALENIIMDAKKPSVSFSMVTAEDLKKVGVTRKRLSFEPAKVTELTEDLTTNAEAEIVDLHSRINKIYAHVNMGHSRMILNEILLALAEISSTQERGVVIFPEMEVTQGEVSDPVSGYEMWHVDYVTVVIEYEDVWDYKKRLLAPGGSKDAFKISKGRLLIVEAKCQSMEQTFVSFIPEAVSQAIALLKSANLQELRFCLSDGQTWTFFILKLENEKLTYYESVPVELDRYMLEDSDLPLRKIVQLLCEWLRPTKTGLFIFD
ncbi:hypothetical protein M378DRAFT_171229 [Amanita muscaria Koide BX008]|uniref:Uncharacterized protein n=1 Tax=Amanita muscaria (strain Koide BX008) TaxID=946122 RepID=A0A0C2S5C5_AMAMK|nr:hypothetical protein M378DRAFT_171229 [Amanita muscaria Koide BX008]